MSTDDKKEILDAISGLASEVKGIAGRQEDMFQAMNLFSEAVDKSFDRLEEGFSSMKASVVHHREMDALVDRLEVKNVLSAKDVRDIRAVGSLS